MTPDVFRMCMPIWHTQGMATDKAPASPLAFGIASVLSDIKRERALEQREMAALTGLTAFQISRWMNAKVDISVPDFLALCAGLGLDPREILDDAQVRAAAYERRVRGE